MKANDSFEVIPSGAALGADIVGLDLTREIDSANNIGAKCGA